MNTIGIGLIIQIVLPIIRASQSECLPSTYEMYSYKGDDNCTGSQPSYNTQGSSEIQQPKAKITVNMDSETLYRWKKEKEKKEMEKECNPSIERSAVQQPQQQPNIQLIPVQAVSQPAQPQQPVNQAPQQVPQQALQQQVPVVQTAQYTQPIKYMPTGNSMPPQYPTNYNLKPMNADQKYCNQYTLKNGLNCNGKGLSTVLVENPKAKVELINFLDYIGIQPPWDYAFDFETEHKHKLPDPTNLKKKVNQLFAIFDKLRDTIIESLIIIEKYIYRGKNYLREDLKDLYRYRAMLHNVLTRLCNNPSPEIRSELFKRFANIKEKVGCIESSFRQIKQWLREMIKLFSKM